MNDFGSSTPQAVRVHQYEGGPVAIHVSKRDRDLALSQAERVVCPGCQGEAWAEASPVTVWRDGQSRTVRVVTCHSGCVTEIKSKRRTMGAANEAGFARTRPTRFEIPITEEIAMPIQVAQSKPAEIARVKEALKSYGKGAKSRILETCRIPAPQLDRWLTTGMGVGPTRLPRLLAWAEEVLKEAEPVVVEAEPEAWAGAEAALDFEPYPETSKPKTTWTPPDVSPFNWKAVFGPWLEQRLIYSLESVGLRLPEGYRFRVSVERVDE